MFKTILSLAFAFLMMTIITSVPVAAQSQADQVKGKVTRLGTGKRAGVDVKLKDNTELKGYIGEIAADHFTIIIPKKGTVTTILYDQVQQIKSTNHSLGFELGLGAAAIGGVILIVVLSMRGS